MMDLADGALLIAASGVGAICGIMGQSIKDWLSKPRIGTMASFDEGTSSVFIYFINAGRRSTEDLTIDVISFDGGAVAGNERTVFHTAEMTIHPKTAQCISFGHLEDGVLRINRSDLGKNIKFSDDSDEGQAEWKFGLPVDLYISACAKDTKACVRILSADADGVRLRNPKGISYRQLKKQTVSDHA